MRRTTWIVLLLAACSDNTGATSKPAPSVLEPATNLRFGTSDTQFPNAGESDWTPLSPEEKRVAVRTMQRAGAPFGVTYLQPEIVLLDGPLPDGAAAVIRRTSVTSTPTILVHKKTISGLTMERIYAALEYDIKRAASVHGTRTLLLNGDSEVTVVQDDLLAGSRLSSESRPLTGSSLAVGLARSAAARSEMMIPRLGTATLLRFQ